MTAKPPIDVDSAELRLLAQLVGVKPSSLAGAFNDPTHFSSYLTTDETVRFTNSSSRLIELISQMLGIANAEAYRALKTRPELQRKLQAKGLLRNGR